MSGLLWYGLGLLTGPFVLAISLVIVHLRATGYQIFCDRHRWTTGDLKTTRRWRLYLRRAWHTYRWHRFGKPRSWATDEQIARRSRR